MGVRNRNNSSDRPSYICRQVLALVSYNSKKQLSNREKLEERSNVNKRLVLEETELELYANNRLLRHKLGLLRLV